MREGLRKIPAWAFVVAAAGVVGVWYWYRHRQTTALAQNAAASQQAPQNAPQNNPGRNAALVQSQQEAGQNTADIVSALQALQPRPGPADPNKGGAGFTHRPWTGEYLQGAGFTPSKGDYGFVSSEGVEFTMVPDKAVLENGLRSGLRPYYQPLPGVAAEAQGALQSGHLPPSTPLYFRENQAALPPRQGQPLPPGEWGGGSGRKKVA